MSHDVTQEECQRITNQLLHTNTSAHEAAEDYSYSEWTIRRHARGECSHDTQVLRCDSTMGDWQPIEMVDGGTSFGRARSEYYCASCDGALGVDGRCGFCDRFDRVMRE